MTLDNIALFRGIGAKMDYLNQRQRVIAQNISNADTPSFRPQDIVDADFSTVLKDVVGKSNGVRPVKLDVTSPGHMPTPGEVDAGRARKQKHTYEVAPAGNSVIMEEQLINSNQTMMDYNLMTNLIQKNTGMIRMSLGGQ
jgi:flagellar basal-body rod protein FlgB